MNYLLDTHVLLWWLNDDSTLSEAAKDAIANGSNTVFVSAASIWEIRIKHELGKLTLPERFWDTLQKEPFDFLDITAFHAFAVGDLPTHHRDPFDRMLIAQAKVERLTIVTRDTQFHSYGIPLLMG